MPKKESARFSRSVHRLGFDELFQLASGVSAPVGVAAAGGDDPTVLEALADACDRGWVKPILCGSENRIRELAGRLSVELGPFKIIDSEEPAAAAVEAIHRGDAKLLMKGQIPTPSLMKAVLQSGPNFLRRLRRSNCANSRRAMQRLARRVI